MSFFSKRTRLALRLNYNRASLAFRLHGTPTSRLRLPGRPPTPIPEQETEVNFNPPYFLPDALEGIQLPLQERTTLYSAPGANPGTLSYALLVPRHSLRRFVKGPGIPLLRLLVDDASFPKLRKIFVDLVVRPVSPVVVALEPRVPAVSAVDVSVSDVSVEVSVSVPALDAPVPALEAPVPALDDPVPALEAPVPALEAPVPALESPVPAVDAVVLRVPAPSHKVYLPESRAPFAASLALVLLLGDLAVLVYPPVPRRETLEPTLEAPVPALEAPVVLREDPVVDVRPAVLRIKTAPVVIKLFRIALTQRPAMMLRGLPGLSMPTI